MSESDTLRVEILTFKGCPNATTARDRVREALEAEHFSDARVDEIDVPNADAARTIHFLGSPTVRVNGEDVEPSAKARNDYGLMCRTYATDGRVEGAPSVELIRKALRRDRVVCEARMRHG